MSFYNIYPSNCKSTFETATVFHREKWEKRNRNRKVPKVGACGRSSVVLMKGVTFTLGSVQLFISRRIHPDGMLKAHESVYSGCSTVRLASLFPPAFSSSDSSSNTSLNTKTSHQITTILMGLVQLI